MLDGSSGRAGSCSAGSRAASSTACVSEDASIRSDSSVITSTSPGWAEMTRVASGGRSSGTDSKESAGASATGGAASGSSGKAASGSGRSDAASNWASSICTRSSVGSGSSLTSGTSVTMTSGMVSSGSVASASASMGSAPSVSGTSHDRSTFFVQRSLSRCSILSIMRAKPRSRLRPRSLARQMATNSRSASSISRSPTSSPGLGVLPFWWAITRAISPVSSARRASSSSGGK